MDIKSKISLLNIGVTILILILFGVGVWYLQKKPSAPVFSERAIKPIIQAPVDQKTVDSFLGSQVLQRTQIFVKDKFPETNPLKQIIKNPF